MYLIEYGAGFFVETNGKDAMDFYLRKITLIKDKTNKLQDIINQKK
jgi:prefoldin subunit 5